MSLSIGFEFVRSGTKIALVLGLVLAPEARADRIVLRGGTEIPGVVVPDPDHPDQVMVQTATASKPIAFPKEQVVKVVAEPGPLNEYFRRCDQVKETAEAQYEFARWCESRKLTGLAEIHDRRAVALDPSFGPSQKKLGRVLHGDRWLTRDELKEAQGLIKFGGRWISKQEKDEIDGKVAATAARASWSRRIKILHQTLIFGTNEKRVEAETQLVGIRDPAAVRPLVQAFGRESESIRRLLDQVLGGIPGPEAGAALIARLLNEPEVNLRGAALDELAHRRDPGTVATLIRALRSGNSTVVGRAAWALAALNVNTAVPKLIPVLVQVKRQVVWVPSASNGGGFASLPSMPRGVPPFAPIGVLTGPVVAPGAVAYGGTSTYAIDMMPGGLASRSGMAAGVTPGPPMPQVVSTFFNNPEVLEALVKLTGLNFGYDQTAWRRWLARGPRPQAPPTRLVPQP
ncbi:MAG: HEAT repeat domain-containing protein [Isosphaeraceae bacterium]